MYEISLADSGLHCRYMGTITGMDDLDPVRWPNSHWRSLKVLSALQTAVNFGSLIIFHDFPLSLCGSNITV